MAQRPTCLCERECTSLSYLLWPDTKTYTYLFSLHYLYGLKKEIAIERDSLCVSSYYFSRTHDFLIFVSTRGVCSGQGGGADLSVPREQALLGCTTDRYCVNAWRIPIKIYFPLKTINKTLFEILNSLFLSLTHHSYNYRCDYHHFHLPTHKYYPFHRDPKICLNISKLNNFTILFIYKFILFIDNGESTFSIPRTKASLASLPGPSTVIPSSLGPHEAL